MSGSIVSRITAILIAFIALGVVMLAQLIGTAGASTPEPILSYPPTPPTPTMGQPPAQAAPALSSAGATSLTPNNLLAGWLVVDSPPALPGEEGLWVERKGHLAQNGVKPAASLSASETALMSPDAYGDVTISVSFYDARNGNVGLIARESGAGFYRVRLQAAPSYDGTAFVVEKVVGGAAAALMLNTGEPLYEPHSWHTFALSVQGTKILVSLDGQVFAEVADAAPLPAGRVGLYTRALGGISFDQITLVGEKR